MTRQIAAIESQHSIPNVSRRVFVAFATLLLVTAGGCTTAYYSTMEQFGQHKRDILKSRIEGAREDQEAAQEQFQTTYEQFVAITDYKGGDIESVYNQLDDEYERSEARALKVKNRIKSIEGVSADLFSEWEAEIDLIQNSNLRRSSTESLRTTKVRYARLIEAMKNAESKMAPVLTAFRDQVLFLKHRLNARAISDLETELGKIEGDVASLIADIDISIREAESFLETLEDGG